MKKILLVLIIVPAFAKSQQRDTSSAYKAGTELIKYERQYTSGVMLQLAGGALVAIGAASEGEASKKQPIIISGGILSLIGFVMQISSASHIKKAGILLRGDKIVIPLNRGKK